MVSEMHLSLAAQQRTSELASELANVTSLETPASTTYIPQCISNCVTTSKIRSATA